MSGAASEHAGFRLATPRLILRDWRDADWPTFFRHTNTPAVMRWLGGVMDAERQALHVERIEACAAAYGHCFWAVERRDDGGHLAGELLGFCGLKRANGEGSPVVGEFEIGWRLREDAWGHGYAREAAQAALEAGFERFGAQRIIALTVVENSASWGLMRRLGMEHREELDHVEPLWGVPRATIVHVIEQARWEEARRG